LQQRVRVNNGLRTGLQQRGAGAQRRTAGLQRDLQPKMPASAVVEEANIMLKAISDNKIRFIGVS
jgi:hypothetical protein